MVESIKTVLMRRDGLTEDEAQDCINECLDDLRERIDNGESPFDICEEYFGLEPDYLDELLFQII